MKYGKVFLTAILAMTLFSGMAYAQTAGVFRLPYDPQQHWSDCTDVGFKLKADQVFMNLNSDLKDQYGNSTPKYHLAEDWNGKCGYDTDKGAPLYAIADGVVELASMPGKNGGWLLIRHPLPNGTSRWILYEHVLDIVVNSGPVYAGQLVAHLGDGNGLYLGAAHLHFEMRRSLFTMQGDPTLDLETNPYYSTLTPQTAMLYSSPSLFIDDRSNAVVQNLVQGQWTNFYQNANAPGSTAFVEYNGERYSLQRAVNAGLIYGMVWAQTSGGWYPYSNITDVFFSAGNIYWIYSFVPGARLNILIPGHNFKEDRVKIDMIRVASQDGRYLQVRPDTMTGYYQDQSFVYSYMQFIYQGNSSMWFVYMTQATNKQNPLIRYTQTYDPDTQQWGNWTQVNVNTLD